MTVYSETYIPALVTVPIYWALIMLPHVLRAFILSKKKSPSEMNIEPRVAVAEAGSGESDEAGLIRRATACHQNGWESFAIFVGGLVAATSTVDDMKFINNCAIVIVVLRLVFTIVYIFGTSPLLGFIRSTVWWAGTSASLALMVKACIELKGIWISGEKVKATWDNFPMVGTIGMPVFFALLMIPHVVRVVYLSRTEDMAQVNTEPRRVYEESDKGVVRRATAAHKNGIENFYCYVAAYFVAAITQGAPRNDASFYNTCFVVILVTRALYNVVYIAGTTRVMGLVRSVLYLAGMGATLAIWGKGIKIMSDNDEMKKFKNGWVMATVMFPVYWALVVFPHFARAAAMARSTNFMDYNIEPRSYQSIDNEQSQSSAAFVRRATAAHQNGWENFLFATAAVFVGIALQNKFFSTCVVVILASRFLFNIAYLAGTSFPISIVRTLTYMVGVGASLALMIKGIKENWNEYDNLDY